MNFLGIDIGTTSLKAAVFSDKLEQLSQATVDYTLETSGVYAEFPTEKYWDITKEGIKKATEGLEIEALSIDTQCETLILTDENGIPVRKAIVWVDNRADEEAKMIEAHFGRKKVYEVTGQPEITATWPASKLLWVKRNEPEIWKKTKKIFLLEDYILYKMTGKFVTEKTLQSSTIYFDIKKGTWWEEMLEFIGVDSAMLPKLYDSGVKIGEYEGMKVVTGAMDQVAGSIGAGIVRKGIISEMTGTFSNLLSLSAVALVSYMTADAFKAKPVYEQLMERMLEGGKLRKPRRTNKVLVEGQVHLGSYMSYLDKKLYYS